MINYPNRNSGIHFHTARSLRMIASLSESVLARPFTGEHLSSFTHQPPVDYPWIDYPCPATYPIAAGCHALCTSKRKLQPCRYVYHRISLSLGLPRYPMGFQVQRNGWHGTLIATLQRTCQASSKRYKPSSGRDRTNHHSDNEYT